MSIVNAVYDRLCDIKGKGPLIIELPLSGTCFNCGKTTKKILNYFVQSDEFGVIVFSSIKKNIKNIPYYKYPLSICGVRCLKKEIAFVLDKILEKLTE
jgi:hypothetical protein